MLILLKILLPLVVLIVPVIAFQSPQGKDWPQEPDGFSGLKFLAIKTDIQKIIKLGSCKVVPPINPMPLETKECEVELTLDGLKLEGSVRFTSPKGGRDDDGQLTDIIGNFGVANAETVKTTLIKMYGEPHNSQKTRDGASTFWNGKRANIILFSSETSGSFIMEPSHFMIGGVSQSNHFDKASQLSSFQPEHR
jgi:hypothetical protein